MKTSTRLKTFLLLFSIIGTSFLLQAQHDNHNHAHHDHTQCVTKDLPVRQVKIATVKKGEAVEVNTQKIGQRLDKNFRKLFKRSSKEIQLSNSSVQFKGYKGWFIYTDVSHGDQTGMYRETIKRTFNNELLITEAKEGEACLSTNCKRVEFVNPPERCRCAEPIDADKPTDVVHRLYFSAN